MYSTPVASAASLLQAFPFPLETQLHFTMMEKNRVSSQVLTTMRMAVDGSFYLDSGKAKLFFSRHEDCFMFHRLEGNEPALALLFMAMPKLPLTTPEIGQQWCDYLPISLVTTGLRRLLYQFGSSFYSRLASASYTAQWESHDRLRGTILIPSVPKQILTLISFTSDGQLLSVSAGDHALLCHKDS